MSAMPLEGEQRVTPLELFFDLVFVFAFTEVTTVLSNDPTWSGLGHGLVILVALWWAWASYAWLTNAVNPEEGLVLATMLVATGAMFVAALAVPEAFGRHGVVFGVAFLIVSVMWLALYSLSARGDPDLMGAILRIAPSTLTGATLIAAGGFVHGWWRTAFWLAALALGFGRPLFQRLAGWRLHPAHFVERHGLIVIIAIGESLVAIGLGTRNSGLGAGEIGTAVLGFVVAASFWLAYFDFFTIRAHQILAERSGTDRIAFARDIYTYLHLSMVTGIVLFAFGVKTSLGHIGDELSIVPALCLCGGPALFLFSFVALRLRITGGIRSGRLVAAVALTALVPVALFVPGIVALALVAGVWVALHAYELIWWRAARADLRGQRVPASAS